MAVTYPTITFVKGGTTVTLPAPAPGGTFRKTRSQAIGRTASGAPVIYDKDAVWYEGTLAFTYLSSSMKAALESFFDTVAGASFTYTNDDGTAYTAYFLDNALSFRQRARGAYDITVRLNLSAAGE